MSPRKRRKPSLLEQAVRVQWDGQDLVSGWLDEIRRGAEKRVDSFETDDVVADPVYAAALQLFGDLNAAVNAFTAGAEKLEAGEVR
jgi:hypothetical protein